MWLCSCMYCMHFVRNYAVYTLRTVSTHGRYSSNRESDTLVAHDTERHHRLTVLRVGSRAPRPIRIKSSAVTQRLSTRLPHCILQHSTSKQCLSLGFPSGIIR